MCVHPIEAVVRAAGASLNYFDSNRVGTRPHIVLEPTEHPLAVEQQTGITIERVQQIAGLVLHPTCNRLHRTSNPATVPASNAAVRLRAWGQISEHYLGGCRVRGLAMGRRRERPR